MDKFTQIANSVLRKVDKVTIKENNEIQAIVKSSGSFGDFMRSLQGKTIQDILDSASFARLYSMNKHGMTGAAYDSKNPDVLLNKFLTKLSDFVNQDVSKIRSGAAETDEFKKKYDYEGHLEREKERKDLFMQVIKEKDPEKKSKLRQKAHAFRNNSEYAEARQKLYDKEDKLVDQFHNSKIEPGQFVNDGSDEYKELEKMFNTLLSLRKIEDQEQFLTKDQEKAIRVAQSLANDPTRRSFQRDPQKEINKAYGDVMKKIAKKIKNIDI